MPSEKQLLEILEKDTVDTISWMVDDPKEARFQMERAEGRLYSLAIPQVDGTLRASHVTDDPEKVINLLKEKGDFYAREGDLCGGLYVSAVPHFWEGRSHKKWDFLPKLSREARGTLYQAIYDRLVDQINSGYITQSEFERSSDIMAQAMTTDYWQILDIVANQPFNIDIPKMAKELGLATPFEPHRVPVDFVGRYLEFNTKRAVDANEALLKLRHGSLEDLTRTDLCNMLKSYGWDGVFTKASMGTNPELVIWSGDKIVAFGDYVPERAELSGPGEMVHINGDRFDASISANRMRADIKDKVGTVFRKERIRKGNKVEDVEVPYPGSLTSLTLSDVGELGVIADAGMQRAAWDTVPTRRFRPRGHADRDGVDIVDPSTLKKIVHLDNAALQELMNLAVELMGMMTMGGPRGLIP